ncbi:MAG: chemotaxis protein CheW [Candidatus Thiodiazotropha sp. (ex Dulcina madagascariensis)]|nr:chemotaxis protein CheW [Candidatus Thiodiazotropha sp. (ex Dulcina madagascariensis)]MCU7925432.1 chemotaxis protein CheW [Candidatus Thiodiazotropha sp. (ex Dulcina madagascariensis)]
MKQSSKSQGLQQVDSKIAEPENALKSYLDTLLSEIDDLPAAAPVVGVKEPSTDADIEIEDVRQSVAAPTPGLALQEGEQERLSEIPAWAENGFQVLLFKVNGITLGIPLTSLVGILDYAGEASQLPGQPAWTLGVIINRDEKVIVIDSARLLMPERLTGNEVARPRRLLLIGDGHLALAVDSISTTLDIEKEAVRWRTGGGGRPWYAGIIIQELSVLLNVNGVLEMLAA